MLIHSGKRVFDLFDTGDGLNVHEQKPALVSLPAVRKDSSERDKIWKRGKSRLLLAIMKSKFKL